MSYSIGEVARIAGVTVRTLHHYDRIGLLVASDRQPNGYRRYANEDLARLQRILFYRELQFPLERIQELLDGDTEPLDHLRRQHEQLLDRRARLDRLITTLERTMDADNGGIDLSPAELFEVFGDEDPTRHDDEVQRRWGDTDAWRQSRERMAGRTKEDWKRFAEQGADLNRRLGEAMTSGEPADGQVAMDLAEEAREQIDRWCYDLSHAGHRALGSMYVEDPRFAATYDEVADGLAVWFRDAIHANAARHGVTDDG